MNTLGQQGGGGGFGGERGGGTVRIRPLCPKPGKTKAVRRPMTGRRWPQRFPGTLPPGSRALRAEITPENRARRPAQGRAGKRSVTGKHPISQPAATTPSGGMPDMKLMRQAMEIIGETEVSQLTDDQKAKLSDLGAVRRGFGILLGHAGQSAARRVR